eukprot:1068687-Amorphochlora_amoeboformis.AAC.1
MSLRVSQRAPSREDMLGHIADGRKIQAFKITGTHAPKARGERLGDKVEMIYPQGVALPIKLYNTRPRSNP